MAKASEDELHRQFITGILGSVEGWVPMGLATGRSKSGKLEIKATEWFEYPRQLEDMVAFAMKKRLGDRRNVYIGPSTYGEQRNENGERSRSIENALFTQTVYMDSDACPPERFRIEPSRHVNTSAGHGHDYWFLNEPAPTKQVAEIAHRITRAHRADGCDPTGWSANKYLRMPTVNTSYDPERPFKIQYHDTGEIYEIDDISGAYDDVEVESIPDRPGSVPEEAAPPVPAVEGLPDPAELLNRVPSSEKRLLDLITKIPKRGEGGWQSHQRWALLLDLLRFGFTPEETVSLAWTCPAAAKWREDQRGIDGLWWETIKASRVVELEQTQSAAEYEKARSTGQASGEDDYQMPEQVVKRQRIRLVTKGQRESVAHIWSFREQYLDYARSRVPVFNEPYHAIASWIILSLGYAEWGYAPKESGPMHPNLYTNTIGESSTGKSESMKIQGSVQRALFPFDDPDVAGANTSKNALIEALIERDGKTSWIHADEAPGLYNEWKAGGWTTGLQETYTLVYDGPVPSTGRTGKKREVGKLAIPVLQFVGTPDAMFDSLDRGMFLSGFLARQIWTIGDATEITRETLAIKQVRKRATKTHYTAMPNFWAHQFAANQREITKDTSTYEKAAAIFLTDEATTMFEDAKWELVQYFEKLDDPELYRTARNRLFDIIWKAAILLAMSEGKLYVDTTHMIRTLMQAEVWVEGLIYVGDRISASRFSKQTERLEKFIAGKPGGEVEVSAIYRLYEAEDVMQVNRYLESLVKQRRLVENRNTAKGTTHYAVPRRPKPQPEEDDDARDAP